MVDKSYFVFFVCVSLPLHYLSLVLCQDPSAPAVYVFGDSLVDCGNNNYLVTLNMVNYSPYGSDFPDGATGRYTNGRTVPDIVAQLVGLPFPPPIKSLDLQNFRSLTGVNYASGGGGILEESGKHFLQIISFSQQIRLFKDTIEQALEPQFEGPEELQRYLSKSIFVITIGNNDYINNYLLPELYDTSKYFTPQTFASYLMRRLSILLERLYKLGARKFAMSQLGPLGCIPRWRIQPSNQCSEDVNQLASFFNNLLPETLERLTSALPGSMFTVAKNYDAIQDMIQYPSKYGFEDVEHPCCLAGDQPKLCTRNMLPCPNPDQHLWWDGYHPTESAYGFIARDCYNGTTSCSPFNILELIQEIHMANKSSSLLLLFVCFSLHHLSLVMCQTAAPPAIYVFGDSLVDCGNNNYRLTLLRVNYTPYGADFIDGATGRYTNGKTFVDFTAQLLGLPLPPAFESLNLRSFRSLTGINYASGGSGILEETGKVYLEVISFREQISNFQKTVEELLQPELGSSEELQRYLSKSIFMISIGNNDYINNYLMPEYYLTSRLYSPQTYAQYLMNIFSRLLQGLYKLGARKMIISKIGPLGCIPRYRIKPSEQCADDVNKIVSNFNSILPETIARLASVLPGTVFTFVKNYESIQAMIQAPSKYGFKDVEHSCCVTGDKNMLCTRDLPPCPNSNQHLWWDGFHPTQKTYSILARDCYNGSAACSPMNIDQLVQA
ncbi:hypothetical protein AQUCO_00200958v1 [Aquilegia coerulea]|uniref:SGNH hydrolase-type esterase domain-containing protein n=1 Tax=Aquilegia coerulea TaxID=218851 RepID=A0A2G5F5P1_AQUCA|nr:hypothetical protein AQUCO_00200958v1 [Aquilegia coerulea]